MSESAHPLVLRAREALARSEIKSAELAVEERLKTAGRDINALEVRYLIQKHRGQLGEAARTLDTVIGINARADWAYNELIQLLLTHGKVADAEQVARAALRANPANSQAHNAFGGILSDLHDLPAGEWHFRRALELTPQLPAPFLTNLANNLVKQGRTDGGGRLLRARSGARSQRHENTDFLVCFVRGARRPGARGRASRPRRGRLVGAGGGVATIQPSRTRPGNTKRRSRSSMG